MNYVSAKIQNYIKYMFDKKQIIKYSVAFNRKDNLNTYSDVVILNDYTGYKNGRLKSLGKYKYVCDRKSLYRCISSLNSLKVLVLSGNDESLTLRELCDNGERIFDVILITNNVGQDVGAYISAVDFLHKSSLNFKYITLMNTSQFLDPCTLKKFIEHEIPKSSICGISYGIGPRFNFIKYTHIQSFLLKLKYDDALLLFTKLSKDCYFYTSKYKIIKFGEVSISLISRLLGLKMYLFTDNGFKQLLFKSSIYSYDHRIYLFAKNQYRSLRKNI